MPKWGDERRSSSAPTRENSRLLAAEDAVSNWSDILAKELQAQAKGLADEPKTSRESYSEGLQAGEGRQADGSQQVAVPAQSESKILVGATSDEVPPVGQQGHTAAAQLAIGSSNNVEDGLPLGVGLAALCHPEQLTTAAALTPSRPQTPCVTAVQSCRGQAGMTESLLEGANDVARSTSTPSKTLKIPKEWLAKMQKK